LTAPFDPFFFKSFFFKNGPNEKGLQVQIPWDSFQGTSFELFKKKLCRFYGQLLAIASSPNDRRITYGFHILLTKMFKLGTFVVPKIGHTFKASPLGAFVCLLMTKFIPSIFQ